MIRSLIVCACILFLAVPGFLSAQAVYSTFPDWTSSDTEVSTGGALADIDNDGWLDLVVANGNDMQSQYVAVYYNQGDGTFPATPDWQSTDQAYNGHLDIADVNGDGWVDVAVVHLLTAGNSAAKLYLNNNGTLSSQPDWSSDEVARSFGISFGDVNNDGRPDLAVATGWAYTPVKRYKNYVYMNINGALETTASWQTDTTTIDQGALFVDADDDGWMDLVYIGSNDQTRLYRNNNGVLDTTPIWQSVDATGQDGILMTAGDVDGDGDKDLFTTDNSQMGNGYFRQYSGLPVNYFTTSATWSYSEGNCSAVALADVDADTDLDLATGAWWDYSRIFLNDGTGFGTPGWSSTGTSVIEKICFGDVDPTVNSVKHAINAFPPDGSRRMFNLSRCQLQSVESVYLDNQPLLPSQYCVSREFGWITVHSAPTSSLVVNFTYSVSLDMAITNWDSSKGNYLYYNLRDHEWLKVVPETVSASTGGTCGFTLESGAENSGRNYLLLGCVTGTSPGYPLPGEAVLPLNWDLFTDIVFAYVNSVIFDDFMGVFDSSGSATARLDAPPLDPANIGIVMSYAYVMNNPFNFASNPVDIEIIP